MGVMSFINRKKKELRDRQSDLMQKRTKKLSAELKEEEARERVFEENAKVKAKLKAVKQKNFDNANPMLSKIGKTMKKNIEKASKNNAKNNAFANTSGKNVFNSFGGSGNNPFNFSGSSDIFGVKGKKKKK